MFCLGAYLQKRCQVTVYVLPGCLPAQALTRQGLCFAWVLTRTSTNKSRPMFCLGAYPHKH